MRGQYKLQPDLKQAIETIGNILVATGKCKQNPCDNVGGDGEYIGDKFEIRAYCWCCGDIHPHGCPPNFKYKDWMIDWYKYITRGHCQNRRYISPKQVMRMLTTVLKEISTKEEE